MMASRTLRSRVMVIGVVAVVLAAALVAYLALRKDEHGPVRIGYQAIALYRHLFIAAEKGFFADEGVEVELSRHVSANRMMEAMISDQLDATGLTNLQVALAVEGKDPGRFKFANMLVWREKSFPDYILVRKDAGIRTPKDLAGKKMGLHPGSAVKAFSAAVLKHFGVDPDKVAFQELKPGIMESAFVSGAIDAIYCMDPAATTILNTGEARVLVANPMALIFPPPVPISGTALASSLVRDRPDDARRVARALERAIRYMREPGHEDEIANCISKYTEIPKDQVARMNDSEYWTLGEVDVERIQQLADIFADLGVVDHSVQVEGLLLDAQFVEE